MIACSILKARGFDQVVNVHQGWNKIKDSGVPVATGTPQNMVAE
jgi:rhodanese-related sulfurtransferase